VHEMIPASPELLETQNPDGGWSYRRGGGSWTEPTCYALLALAAEGRIASDAAQRGARWLGVRQRADGGWAPRDGVDESTWVTALVLLLPTDLAQSLKGDRASSWLLSQTGRESGLVQRLRSRLLGVQVEPSQSFEGWPWFPGAAAWVTPTALSILALEKLDRRRADTGARERIVQGRAFLLGRRCRDGGWNHGSTKALGYDSDSYPETTGVALLALHDARDKEISTADTLAEQQLSTCRSREAAYWLTLALSARGRAPEADPTGTNLPRHGSTIEVALAALARTAYDGHNLFLE
jgi:hypothetical protein